MIVAFGPTRVVKIDLSCFSFFFQPETNACSLPIFVRLGQLQLEFPRNRTGPFGQALTSILLLAVGLQLSLWSLYSV